MSNLFGGDSASFGDQLRALKQEYGTVTALAKGLGVDRRTIQRWETGAIRAPKASTAEKVGREYRDKRSQGRVVPSDSNVKVGYSMGGKKGRGTRKYTVDGTHLDLRPGTMDQARKAFVVGGGEAAAKAFVDGIRDDWYHDHFEDDLRGEESDTDSELTSPGSIS